MEPLTHKGTQPLETERLILRRFTVDDAEAMFRNWASDPKVTEFLTWQTHESVDFTRELLAGWARDYENENYYHWCIVLKETGEPVGASMVVGINEKLLSAELGYCLGSAFWGRGIMPEAIRAILKFLFNEVGFYRISAKHDIGNPKSGRVMEKCGMQYEGILRGVYYYKEQFVDCKQYAILKHEI